jgi:hypothetical protein
MISSEMMAQQIAVRKSLLNKIYGIFEDCCVDFTVKHIDQGAKITFDGDSLARIKANIFLSDLGLRSAVIVHACTDDSTGIQFKIFAKLLPPKGAIWTLVLRAEAVN